MRTLVIPDIHEDLDFLKYIMAKEDTATFDHVVMLGDYFDASTDVEPCHQRLQRVAGTILGFAEILGDKLHLLCGNHDLPYYALRPACGEHRGKPNPVISQWLHNTSCERAEIVNQLWDEPFWKRLRGAVLIDGWLFSHAGMHPDLWPGNGQTAEAQMKHFDARWDRAIDQMFEAPEDPMFAIGKARGGGADIGGPLWLDWDAEFEDKLEIPQIAGHTRCAKQTQQGRSFCIDMAQAAYAIVEDGEVQLNIVPGSWLGEVMLDGVS
ncbi:MAG: hypothetical protein GVY36_08350 [Verrucomicrobia bacterium]|jgi:hypothetical protein|nr:hypothetical protein [Verrucomicrobiota bacterium]